jgi:hypothetical protein
MCLYGCIGGWLRGELLHILLKLSKLVKDRFVMAFGVGFVDRLSTH